VITNNAENPHGFYPTLPANLFTTMTDAERQALGNEPLALLKRVAFLHICEPLFTADQQRTRAEHHRQATAARAAVLYQGPNAVP